MEAFSRQLKDNRVAEELFDILNRKKPFAHFNAYMHNSKYREEWLRYRQEQLENHVRLLISEYIEDQSRQHNNDVLIDDDGNLISGYMENNQSNRRNTRLW
jgi:hypothetical protein